MSLPEPSTARSGRAGALRVAAWPDDRGNPYQRLFYSALAPHDVEFVGGLEINDAVLKRRADEIDVLHLHWPEYAWRVSGSGLVPQLKLIAGLYRFLGLATRLGIQIWWTAHNAAPHEGRRVVNRVGYGVVARKADLVIVHSARAAAEVTRRYGARTTVVVPHGNFRGAYPAPRPRAEVRAELGLSDDRPLVACLGAVRDYKGVPTAVDAVAALGGAVQLIVAGDPKPDVDLKDIDARRQGKDWIKLRWQRLSDQEFADVASASDAVLLPYRRATTSGVLLAAWTFGRGVVASDIPCFSDELQLFPGAGVVATPDDARAFAAAITEYLARPAEDRDAAATRAADAREWEHTVASLRPHIEAARARRRAGSGMATGEKTA